MRRRLITFFVLFAYGEAPLTPEAVLRVAGEMASRRAAAHAGEIPGAPGLTPGEPDGPALSPVNFSSIEHGERFVVACASRPVLLPPPCTVRPRAPEAVRAPLAREVVDRPRPRGPPSRNSA